MPVVGLVPATDPLLPHPAHTPVAFESPLAPLRTSRRPRTRAPQPRSYVVAGGGETTTPIEMRAMTANGALFTDRGLEYKTFNEDAAVLGVAHTSSGEEVVFAGAFDQAGGMGSVAGRTGEASRIAASHFERAAKSVAGGADAEQALRSAVLDAHDEVNALGVNAATTFVGCILQNGRAVLANCGDSGAVLIGRDGQRLAETEPHSLGEQMQRLANDPNAGLQFAHCLTTSVGSRVHPTIDIYRWAVQAGDRLVVGSDGLLDSNLAAQAEDLYLGKPWTESNGQRTLREVTAIVARHATAQDATQALVSYVRGQTRIGSGKPDNTTIVVVDIGTVA